MASMIHKAVSTALKTFSRTSQRVSNEDLSAVKSALSQIRSKDINFDEKLVSKGYEGEDPDNVAPCTYIEILEDQNVSIGVFVLRNASIPLHDHPGMFGLCKVISGKMAVTSYSLLKDENEVLPSNLRMNLPRQFIKPVIPKGETTLSPEDECCVLSPEEGNIHEISPIDGPAAFLDILAPPYDHETGKRVCHYYQTIGMEKSKDRGDIMWLEQAGQPRDFWCDTAPYLGPEL